MEDGIKILILESRKIINANFLFSYVYFYRRYFD